MRVPKVIFLGILLVLPFLSIIPVACAKYTGFLRIRMSEKNENF